MFDSVESANAAVNGLIFVHDGESIERFQAQNIIFGRVEFYGIYSLEWQGTEIWRFEFASQQP